MSWKSTGVPPPRLVGDDREERFRKPAPPRATIPPPLGGAIYLTERTERLTLAERDRPVLAVSRQMMAAAADRLRDSEVASSELVVEVVILALAEAGLPVSLPAET